MHEDHDFEKKIERRSARISEKLGGATVVIVVGGAVEQNIPRTMVAAHINYQACGVKGCLQE